MAVGASSAEAFALALRRALHCAARGTTVRAPPPLSLNTLLLLAARMACVGPCPPAVRFDVGARSAPARMTEEVMPVAVLTHVWSTCSVYLSHSITLKVRGVGFTEVRVALHYSSPS